MYLNGIEIEWHENPLRSIVRLNDYGRLRLRYGIALEGLEHAKVVIQMDRDYPLPKTGRWYDSYDYLDVKDIAEDIDKAAKAREHDLTEIHCGDCTCVPMSCSKCHAESLLDVWTTPSLGKHEGSWVQGAYKTETTTLAEALHSLHGPIKASWGEPKDWEMHIPRWTVERDKAVAWLENYADIHGFKR